MKVNFFWKGDNFTYLNRLCILSHITVGHEPIMWLSGKTPNSKHWINDLSIKIKNADEIININNFLQKGGNFKTASDLWSFSFLYQTGGLYCDTDAIAIKHFPKDDWILCTCDPADKHNNEKLSIGIIAAPKGQQVFLNSINNIKTSWGNVTIFGNEYQKIYGHTNSTHQDTLFYPFPYYEWRTLLSEKEIPNVYSVHLYHTLLEKNNMILKKEQYNPNTMLGKIIKKFDN